MTLRNPWALWGLLLITVPILVHLLARPRARRLVFPSVRFVPASSLASLARRTLADWPLLLVRVAAVFAAVFAAADPVIVTSGRRTTWAARTSRAIVVDVRPAATGASVAAGTAAEAQVRELAGASFRAVIVPVASQVGDGSGSRGSAQEALDLAARQAVAWLRDAPPSKRELVVFSAFGEGTWSPRTFALPPGIGLRLVRTGDLPQSVTFPTRTIVTSGDGLAVVEHEVTASPEGTSLTASRTSATAPDLELTLRASPEEQWLVDAAFEAVLRQGVPDAPIGGPTTILWPNAPDREQLMVSDDTPPAWMARVVEAAGAVRAAVRGGELFLATELTAGSPHTPQLIRAVLGAAAPPRDAFEVNQESPAALVAAERPASPPDADSSARAEEADRRWLWASVLALLGAEWRVRSRRPRALAARTRREAAA